MGPEAVSHLHDINDPSTSQGTLNLNVRIPQPCPMILTLNSGVCSPQHPGKQSVEFICHSLYGWADPNYISQKVRCPVQYRDG